MEHPAYGQVRPVTKYASVLLANNPNHMTLDGTNSWIVRAPGADKSVIIDPGPAETAHLRELAAQGPVAVILITHHHHDHTEGAAELAAVTGAPVRALDPAWCDGAEALHDGERIELSGVPLRVLVTAGHTRDSVCFVVDDGDEPAVFTGDSILGRGTTVVVHPDGDLGSYLGSLRMLGELPAGMAVLPGHGPELPDVAEVARGYLAHRMQRLDQVRAAVRDLGAEATARGVVDVVYADVVPKVRGAAELTVQAQLAYLRERGEL